MTQPGGSPGPGYTAVPAGTGPWLAQGMTQRGGAEDSWRRIFAAFDEHLRG